MKAVAGFLIMVLAATAAPAGELSLESFLVKAPQNDPGFARILMDELKLRHKKALDLPATDWVLAVLGDYELGFGDSADRDGPGASVGLDRLIPRTGTSVSVEAGYAERTAAGGRTDFEVTLAQDIARNAFGRAVRLEDEISGIEIAIARHQIVEAYEDYLARLVGFYLDWYFAWENVRAGRAGHLESLALLDNLRERRTRSVALDVDVDKVRLQVMGKEERVVQLEAEYEVVSNLVRRAIGVSPGTAIEPADPTGRWSAPEAVEPALAEFDRESRTARLLRSAEERGARTVLRYADDLLPSIRLRVGYAGSRDDAGGDESRIVSSVSVGLPLSRPREKARHETAKIDLEKDRITTRDVLSRVRTDLRNLAVRIGAEQKRITMTEEKIRISEGILAEEKENYSFGRTSLNDLIRFVDSVENERFARISRSVQRTRLIAEWRRLSDRLVSSREVLDRLNR